MFDFSKKEINFIEVTGRVITIIFFKGSGRNHFTFSFNDNAMFNIFLRDLEKEFDLVLKEDLSNDLRDKYIYVVNNSNIN